MLDSNRVDSSAILDLTMLFHAFWSLLSAFPCHFKNELIMCLPLPTYLPYAYHIPTYQMPTIWTFCLPDVYCRTFKSPLFPFTPYALFIIFTIEPTRSHGTNSFVLVSSKNDLSRTCKVWKETVMNFSDSNHQTVKAPDWIWSFRLDLAPLSRNRIKRVHIARSRKDVGKLDLVPEDGRR